MKYRIVDYVQIIICFFLLCIASTIFIFFDFNYQVASEKSVDFRDENVNSLFLRVSDVYGTDGEKSLSEFFSEDDALKRMQQFCSAMHDEYEFLEFDKQALLLRKAFNYKDEFRIDYDSPDYGINDEVGVSLNSVQVGGTTYQSFNLDNQIIEGRGFNPKSFIFDNQTPVEVILGYEYLEVLDLGDIIEVNYLSKDMPLKVVGFLKKDTSISINNEIYFLDRYITMPFVDLDTTLIPINDDDHRFQNILYSLKTWGYVKINNGENYYDYRENVEQISRNLNLKYVLNEGYVNPYITNIANTLNSTKGVLWIISIILLLALTVAFVCVHIWSYNRNKKNYAIKLICGCSLQKLKLQICFQIFINFIFSVGIAILINKAILGYRNIYTYESVMLNYSINKAVIFEFGIMLVVFLFLNYYINKSNIYNTIRK